MHPIAAVQTEYSLLYREEAEETRKTTTELGMSFVAYSPLGRGFLTGAIKSFADVDGRRAAHPRFQEQNFDQNRALVAKIEAVAAEKSCTPSQVTWLGCWRRDRTSSQSPARATPLGWMRTSGL